MSKHNPANERIKRRYFDHLRHARGLSEASIDPVAQALSLFETYTKARDFKRFHIEQAKGFKRELATRVSERTQKPLSKATTHSTLMALKAFFQWLSREPGYRGRLNFADADYFNLTAGEVRVATARRDERVPSIEQILHVLRTMPAESAVERRDRALIAFTLLTGARDRGDCLHAPEAHRSSEGLRASGCTRRSHEVLQDLPYDLLPRGRGGSKDRGRGPANGTLPEAEQGSIRTWAPKKWDG